MSYLNRQAHPRRAMTVLEVVAALGLLFIAIVFLGQITLEELSERNRQDSRLQVLEAATNLLESARAGSVDAITPEWATAQRFPEHLTERLLDAKLEVTVEPYDANTKIKKVTVRITWLHGKGRPTRPVVLIGYFGPRAATQTESKP